MKALGGAIALWSLVVSGLLYFDPGLPSRLLGCMRLVGRSEACEAQQQVINEAIWWLHTLPLLAAVVAGYVAVLALRIWHITRRRRVLPESIEGRA